MSTPFDHPDNDPTAFTQRSNRGDPAVASIMHDAAILAEEDVTLYMFGDPRQGEAYLVAMKGEGQP